MNWAYRFNLFRRRRRWDDEVRKLNVKWVTNEVRLKLLCDPSFVSAANYSDKVRLLPNEFGHDGKFRYIT